MRLASVLTLTAIALAPTALRAQSAPAPDTLTAYDGQAVGIRHLVSPLRDGTTADAQGHVFYSGKWDAFIGVDHHPIDEEAFFRIVGRDDLSRRYRRVELVKNGLHIGGWALVVGGAIAATLAVMPGAEPAGQAEGGGSSRFSPVWGLGAMGTGLLSLLVSHLLDPTPVDADEADRLARDYDQTLRSRLGNVETASRN